MQSGAIPHGNMLIRIWKNNYVPFSVQGFADHVGLEIFDAPMSKNPLGQVQCILAKINGDYPCALSCFCGEQQGALSGAAAHYKDVPCFSWRCLEEKLELEFNPLISLHDIVNKPL